MSDINQLTAEPRDRAGKGAARATRRAGRVPAVIYGAKKDPVMVSLEPEELRKALHTGTFYSSLYDIQVGSKKERVLPRDVQFHPVKDFPMHVDFLRVSASTKINVMIPVVFINEEESVGLERGGVLNVVRHEIEVYCRADDIPETLEVNLAGLDIGDSAHISGVNLPDGVEPAIADRDFTIATIAAPSVVRDEAAEETAAAEAEAAEGEEGEEGEGEEGETEEGGESEE